MSKNFFDYSGLLKKNEYSQKLKTLKGKSTLSKEEKQDLHILLFQQKANLLYPFGIILEKGTVLETIFGNNPFEHFTETEQSLKWDFMVLNFGYDETKKDLPNEINSVYPIISFYKGDKLNATKVYEILSSGGGGEGGAGATTPPPKQPVP
jgi:hypothetical protein